MADPSLGPAGDDPGADGAGLYASLDVAGMSTDGWTEHVGPAGRKYYYNHATGVSTWERPEALGPDPDGGIVPQAALAAASSMAASMPYGAFPGYHMQQTMMAAGMGGFSQPLTTSQMMGGYGMAGGAPHAAMYGAPGGHGGHQAPTVGPGPPIFRSTVAKGPPGCNLFIFHIPNDMTNVDLFNAFAPFGNVISARIMVEKETGRSRGFGFVSYDTHESATEAIKHMNGYQIGRKRLKVQLKKEKGSPAHGDMYGDSMAGSMPMGMPQTELPAGMGMPPAALMHHAGVANGMAPDGVYDALGDALFNMRITGLPAAEPMPLPAEEAAAAATAAAAAAAAVAGSDAGEAEGAGEGAGRRSGAERGPNVVGTPSPGGSPATRRAGDVGRGK